VFASDLSERELPMSTKGRYKGQHLAVGCTGVPETYVAGAVESCLTFKPRKDLAKGEGHSAALSGNQNFCSRPHLLGRRKEIFRTEPQRRLRRGAAIPVIKVGRLKRVPVRAMEAKLDKLCRQPIGDVARELTDKLKGE
jgi:hypothetical protein